MPPSSSCSLPSLSQQHCYPLFHNHPLHFSLPFSTNTSHLVSFSASKEAPLNASEKPELLNLFRNWGFSNSHLYTMLSREPWLLSCNPNKRVLPKFEFLLSKGASTSDIVSIVTKTPRFLSPSLENHIIPTYELVHSFLLSDEETVACIIRNTLSFCSSRMSHNIKLLIGCGVSESNIAILLRKWPSILCSIDLLKEVEEVKRLGFNPSKTTFSIALLAKHTVCKSKWDEKIGVFKKWGWDDETILEAFRRQPNCMLVSCDKINVVMNFWVKELGWDVLALVRGPDIFGFSLEKKIIPRAYVLKYLLGKGLMKKDASLITPFRISEILFLQKFVECFEEEETSQLLNIYWEKLNVQDNREKVPFSKLQMINL
ncbi:PREDICTED: uncharacterized protein LOC109334384 [Lupinus angustifolius]|nr:PREDICTED: uncharacterized protein LOC109334384 [Lupinus angustifolius]